MPNEFSLISHEGHLMWKIGIIASNPTEMDCGCECIGRHINSNSEANSGGIIVAGPRDMNHEPLPSRLFLRTITADEIKP